MVDPDAFVSKMREIMRDELDDESTSIDMHTTRDHLGNWDSLAHVRLVTRLEREYGIQFEVAEIETVNSVRGFFDSVNRHLE